MVQMSLNGKELILSKVRPSGCPHSKNCQLLVTVGFLASLSCASLNSSIKQCGWPVSRWQPGLLKSAEVKISLVFQQREHEGKRTVVVQTASRLGVE